MAGVYEKIIEYIDGRIIEEITVSDIAKFAGYSRRHLYRLFQAHSGVPIREYIRRRRLAAAADEIRSDRKLYDVALDCGYETPAGFYKAFQNMFGCSPSDYKNNREDIFMSKANEIKPDPKRAELYAQRGRCSRRLNLLDEG